MVSKHSLKNCIFSTVYLISGSCLPLQRCPKVTNLYTLSFWTLMCTWSGRMLPVSHTFAWPSTWMAVGCHAPCSRRRPVSGTVEMASGWTSTSIVLEPPVCPSSKTHRASLMFMYTWWYESKKTHFQKRDFKWFKH